MSSNIIWPEDIGGYMEDDEEFYESYYEMYGMEDCD